GRRSGCDRCSASVVASARARATLSLGVPLHVVRRRAPRGGHHPFGRGARVGSRLPSPVEGDGLIRSGPVKNRNDETGCDRRGFLKCTAWVGTGAVWTMASGILKGMPIEQAASSGAGTEALRCVQISDSHIGFNKGANPDVTATLRIAIAKIDAL